LKLSYNPLDRSIIALRRFGLYSDLSSPERPICQTHEDQDTELYLGCLSVKHLHKAV